MSATRSLLIIFIAITTILAAGCTQPAASQQKAPDVTPVPTRAPTVAPLTSAAETVTTAPGRFLVHFPWTSGEAWRPSTAPHDPEQALDFHVEGYSAGQNEKPLAVRAAAPGTVFYATYSYGNDYYTDATKTLADYGNMVVLKHDGAYTMYTHLKQESPAPLRTGDDVAAGQRIGWMGYSGWSKTATQRGAHLHFAVIEGIDFMFNIVPKADWGFYELDGSKAVVLEKDYISQNAPA